MDGSDDVSDVEFEKLKRVLLMLVRGLSVDESQTRLGIVIYGSKPGDVIPLSGDRMELARAVRRVKKIGGPSKPYLGLKEARDMYTSRARYRVPKVCMNLGRGISSSAYRKTSDEAELARDDGIKVLSMGLGATIDPDEVESIAWSKGQAYVFGDEDDLMLKVREIPDYVCGGN